MFVLQISIKSTGVMDTYSVAVVGDELKEIE